MRPRRRIRSTGVQANDASDSKKLRAFSVHSACCFFCFPFHCLYMFLALRLH
jgi:hypothetical protein